MRTRQRSDSGRRPEGWPTYPQTRGLRSRVRAAEGNVQKETRVTNPSSSVAPDNLPGHMIKANDMLQPEDEQLLTQLGLKTDMVGNTNIYLQEINEFADIQMYGNLYDKGVLMSDPEYKYKQNVRMYLAPFADQITPGSVMPYSRQYEEPSDKAPCGNPACSYSYDEEAKAKGRKMIYITSFQAYGICTTIMSQLLNSEDEIFTSIDWVPVSKAAQLPVKLCEDFWWSFDIAHMKDGKYGFFVNTDRKHFRETDANYYREFEQRVRHLISLGNDIRKGCSSSQHQT
ncbi:hypothetical protein BgAZ_110630 [Babesia gibsoni]|uniref:Uncharacterized protein n=1 Tax=Babesia gibsoni TaxID=33632 RepID=A0AAD8PH33_BABGI|nr:hypothetical protein BgAZ_110630 [Babesia gibsoni]